MRMRKAISILSAVIMVCTLMPMMAFADTRIAYVVGNTSTGVETFYYDSSPNSKSGNYMMPLENNKLECLFAVGLHAITFDSSFKDYKPTSAKDFCRGWTNLDSIANLNNLDTSEITDMSYMFYGCDNVTSLDLSSFDTSKVTDMSNMFSYCKKLQSLDLTSFNTAIVTNMKYMFNYCENLSSISFGNFFITTNVTDMENMFYYCSNITKLDVSRFNTAKVTNMKYMFGSCSKLEYINVNGFRTSEVTDMKGMFSNCRAVKSLNVSNFDTSKVKDMSDMFNSCSKLTKLDLSSFDTSSVEYNLENGHYGISDMFTQIPDLTLIYASNRWQLSDDVIANSTNVFYGTYYVKGGEGSGVRTSGD